MSIIITIIIFGIIVLIHEFGHFIVATKSGVLVEEFAIGMGKKIFGIKRGDTLYSIRIFPLGGFCRMADENQPDTEKIGLNNANVLVKIAIVLAGPFMNFVLAFVICTILVMVNGFGETTVQDLKQGYPAQQAGIVQGDKIVEFNGSKVRIYSDLWFNLMRNNGKSAEITIKRNGEKITKTITPVQENGQYITGLILSQKSPMFGEKIGDYKRANILETFYNGYWEMVYMVKTTVIGLSELFTSKLSVDEVTGPIGLTTVIGSTYKESIKYSIATAVKTMANMVALLSANLGIMNLLPIPALDGGRFIFLLIELIRRKPLPPEKEGIIHLAGFVLLMIFAVFIAFNDITKLI